MSFEKNKSHEAEKKQEEQDLNKAWELLDNPEWKWKDIEKNILDNPKWWNVCKKATENLINDAISKIENPQEKEKLQEKMKDLNSKNFGWKIWRKEFAEISKIYNEVQEITWTNEIKDGSSIEGNKKQIVEQKEIDAKKLTEHVERMGEIITSHTLKWQLETQQKVKQSQVAREKWNKASRAETLPDFEKEWPDDGVNEC